MVLKEDQTLEFKETLPAKDGNADSWQLGQNKIGSYARDTLAKEVVAFANAYGGVIIVGIAETEEKPPRANDFANPLIRNCIDCAERLGPSLRSIIDPPVAAFDIRAFPKPNVDTGEGLIVVRVGSSTQAPHGVGRPPEAHVRRRNVSEPLTMRDLHNCSGKLELEKSEFSKLGMNVNNSCWNSKRENTRAVSLSIGSRFQLLSRIWHFAALRFQKSPSDCEESRLNWLSIRLSSPSLDTRAVQAVYTFLDVKRPPGGWQPKAHGARAEQCSGTTFSLWSIGDDGVVDVTLLSLSSNNQHDPRWFSAIAVKVLLVAEKLRLRAGAPDVPFEIDA